MPSDLLKAAERILERWDAVCREIGVVDDPTLEPSHVRLARFVTALAASVTPEVLAAAERRAKYLNGNHYYPGGHTSYHDLLANEQFALTIIAQLRESSDA